MEEKSKKTTKRREIDGIVVGNKMNKTVKVRVDTLEAHPVYKKVVDKKKVFFAHTEEDLEVGEKVTIRESKPYSKKVRWLVINESKKE